MNLKLLQNVNNINKIILHYIIVTSSSIMA